MNPLISIVAIATLISAGIWTLTYVATHHRFSKTLAKILLILGLVLLLFGWWSPVASATLHFSKEANQWVYQAQHVLSDADGSLWEVTVLKPMKEDPQGISLWLITQSSSIHLDPLTALTLTTDSGKQFTAPNITRKHFIGELPAQHMGHYDIQALLPDLKDGRSLQLQIPTQSETPITLEISSDVLDEWIDVGTCAYLLCR
ncbi:MAG: DUF3122 domain-containing protein [Cyanobacteria bacterium P01_A01_bin.37]